MEDMDYLSGRAEVGNYISKSQATDDAIGAQATERPAAAAKHGVAYCDLRK